MGGGMRQAGYFAAAGIFALEQNVSRLREDHARAKLLEAELRSLPYVASVLPVETNIVIFTLNDSVSAELFLQTLRTHGVQAGAMGRQTIRFVFHLDVSDDQMNVLLQTLRSVRVAL
jgi:threonine aldolase